MSEIKVATLPNEVAHALQNAVERVGGINHLRSESADAIRTPRVIVFNSVLFRALLAEYVNKGQTFSDIRRKDPRLFHTLLGMYVGDVKTKDRLYTMQLVDGESGPIDGAVFEAWVLTPEISARHFHQKHEALARLLRRYGKVKSYKIEGYDHIEAPLNRYAGDHPNHFRRTKYLSSVWLNSDLQLGQRRGGTFRFFDSFLIGNGHAGKTSEKSAKIPKKFCDYSGPFLRIIMRCRKDRAPEFIKVVTKCVEVLI